MNIKIFPFCVLFILSISYGQTRKEMESSLLIHFNKLPYWSTYNNSHKISESVNPLDSLDAENVIVKNLMLEYTSKFPETISGSIEELAKNGVDIASSEDGLFRIYSWDTFTGGTMHFFDNVYQYKSGEKVYSYASPKDTAEGGDPGAWYSDVYSLKTNDKTYYLGHSHSIYSNIENAETIKFFSVENNILNDNLKLASTYAGLENYIGLQYDLSKINYNGEYPLKLISYNNDKKTINVPVLNKSGKQTGKFTAYKFNGKYFTAEK